jgi:alkanesulfonate monooxygenase SsuD/methylene tetrahydromethanopterin reductase-like flavin-dependent oxidoreductase (luciferase family)
LLVENGRSPQDMHYSLMTGTIFGRDDAELQAKLNSRGTTAEAMRDRGLIVGTGDQLDDQLAALAEAGVQRIMLQWLDLDDLAGLEAMAKAVL